MDYLADYAESVAAGEPVAVDTFIALANEGTHIPEHDHMEEELEAWQSC